MRKVVFFKVVLACMSLVFVTACAEHVMKGLAVEDSVKKISDTEYEVALIADVQWRGFYKFQDEHPELSQEGAENKYAMMRAEEKADLLCNPLDGKLAVKEIARGKERTAAMGYATSAGPTFIPGYSWRAVYVIGKVTCHDQNQSR